MKFEIKYACPFTCLGEREKTIVWLLTSYKRCPTFRFNEQNYTELAEILCFDEEKIKMILSINDDLDEHIDIIEFSDGSNGKIRHYDYNLFYGLFYLSMVSTMIKKINPERIENLLCEELNEINSLLSLSKNSMSTYVCMKREDFDVTLFPFYNDGYALGDMINLMRMILDHNNLKGESVLHILIRIIKFELYSQYMVLHVLLVTTILMNSPFLEKNMTNIACEFHDFFHFILRNARLFSLQTNMLPTQEKDPNKRDSSCNTTRLRMCYGYSNFDAYVLRLDFAHKGENFIHVNNQSPAKISSYIFPQEIYEQIIEIYPESKDFFIEYENRFALKERGNCSFSEKTKKIYDDIEKMNSHYTLFSGTYPETDIDRYLSYFSQMMPKSLSVIKRDDDYFKKCFNYSKIMELTNLLYLSCFSMNDDVTEKIVSRLIDVGVRYRLIRKEDIPSNKSDVITYIIDIAKETLDRIGNI